MVMDLNHIQKSTTIYYNITFRYLDNISLVDKGIKKVNQLMDNFYNDKKTAFLFTADHGMSDRG